MNDQGLVKFLLQVAVLVVNGVRCNPSLRSDDPLPMEPVVQQLSARLDALTADHNALLTKVNSQQTRIEQLEAEKQRHVAFTAFIPEGTSISFSNNAIIPFHSVIVNSGNAYNPHTAVFTAPYDGDYFFSVHVDVSANYEVVSLRKNDVAVAFADSDDTVSTHRSTSAVLGLRVGDVVTVNQERADAGGIDSGDDNIFTGFLLR